MKRKKKTLKKKALPAPEQNIKDFQVKGIDALHALNQKELEAMVLAADDAYHGEKSAPLMTDAEYDIIKDTIQTRYPKSKASTSVGAPVTKNKVSLPYPMPSMDKSSLIQERGHGKHTGSLRSSAKLMELVVCIQLKMVRPTYTPGDGKETRHKSPDPFLEAANNSKHHIR